MNKAYQFSARYHHLNCDDSRPDARQHEPEPQQSEVADDDGERERDAVDLERAERQRISQRKRQDEHDDDGEVDAVPASVADVHVYRVHHSTKLLSSVPVGQLETLARHLIQRTGVVHIKHLRHNRIGCKTVTRSICRGGGCFSPILSVPIPFLVASLPPFPSPSIPYPRSSPSNDRAKGFEEALLASQAGENDICSQQTRSMGSKYTEPSPGRKRVFGVIR